MLREMSKKQVFDLLNNEKYDIEASIVTNFHQIGLTSFCKWLFDETKKKSNVIICIQKHSKTGIANNNFEIVEESKFYKMNRFIGVVEKNSIWEKIHIFLKCLKNRKKNRKNTLYVIDTLSFVIECLAKTDYNIVLIRLDDGASSYFGRFHWALTQIRNTGNISQGFKYYLSSFGKDFIKKLLGLKEIDFSMFNKENFFNPSITKYYKDTFEKIKLDYHLESKNKFIIFLNQLSYEDTKEQVLLKQQIFKQCIEMGYTVFIKNHPRETQNYSNDTSFKFIPKELSIESVITNSITKPEFVVGWFSTALFTLSSFWSIPCYSLCDYVNSEPFTLEHNFTKLVNEAMNFNQLLFKGKDLFKRLSMEIKK